MGCVCSRGDRKVDMGDELSFSDMVVAGDVVAVPAKGGKAPKSFYHCGKIKMTPGKAGASKVPEMNSILGRAGIVGLGKAVEVLDTLGSSMSNLNTGSGFLYGMVNRGNKISVLAFEVANTIAKGATLMVSLSEENVQLLKSDIRQSEGIRQLVSTDFQELLCIVATDKREEFNVFSKEVVRFGNLCKDPQWHNLTRLDLDPTPRQQLEEEAKTTMQDLLNLVQHTSELYHELHALDRLEQDYQRKLREEESFPTSQQGQFGPSGETLAILHGELKQQRKLVNSLKKKSLWSRTFEEVIYHQLLQPDVLGTLCLGVGDRTTLEDASHINESGTGQLRLRVQIVSIGRGPDSVGLAGHRPVVEYLVDIITFLHKEIFVAFGHTGINITDSRSDHNPQRLGVLGLALHYANIINQIDNISGVSMVWGTSKVLTRNSLSIDLVVAFIGRAGNMVSTGIELRYNGGSLVLNVPLIKSEMHKILQWIVPMADNTVNTEFNKRAALQYSAIRIQTLYHADKDKTDEYLLQLAVWLHHLVSQVKNRGYGLKTSRSSRYPGRKNTPLALDTKQNLSSACNDKKPIIIQLSEEDRKMLESISSKRLVLRRSKSHGYINKEKEGRTSRVRGIGSSSCRRFRFSN
ncbi:hypothetical protein Taro_029616 [Colocasia esculenta]|uniref:DUF3475 domain-containing protein n=1 Tax=Colocasia esculenta TaxID=4460 RepID=A0A843VXR0_COLES|nr:hypothetical protein [Colocasia esculenta]